MGAVLVVALWEAVARAARLGRRSRRRGEVMVVGTLLVAIVALLVDSDPLSAATDLLIAANTLVIGVVIGRALLRERTVTISTLAGALSLYLLPGSSSPSSIRRPSRSRATPSASPPDPSSASSSSTSASSR